MTERNITNIIFQSFEQQGLKEEYIERIKKSNLMERIRLEEKEEGKLILFIALFTEITLPVDLPYGITLAITKNSSIASWLSGIVGFVIPYIVKHQDVIFGEPSV